MTVNTLLQLPEFMFVYLFEITIINHLKISIKRVLRTQSFLVIVPQPTLATPGIAK